MLRRFVLSFALLCWAGAACAQGDLTEEPGFLRATIAGRVARLESLAVKRADASGKLPIALITHGKPTTQGRMLDEHASDYIRQACDLARRGWLAVVVMRRGFGGSDGPLPVNLSCASASPLERFAADADDLEA